MNNFIRFLIGLVLIPLVLLAAIILLVPLFIVGSAILTIIVIIALAIILIGGYLTFVYYIMRKEPALTLTKDSVDFHLTQGKKPKQ